MLGIEYWNEYIKPTSEVDVQAEPGDYVIEIGGILFLLQRKNDFNNVVCFRTKKSSISVREVFMQYAKWLISQNIQYIRVEGNVRRYFFLQKLHPAETTKVMYDYSVSDRNVFYIKLI